MWNTFVSEFAAQNGAGLEFRLLVISWSLVIVGLAAHSIYNKFKKGEKTEQSHIIKHQYKRVS